MRLITAILLTAALLLGLCGCKSAPETTASQPARVGLYFADPTSTAFQNDLEAALDQVGYTLTTVRGEGDIAPLAGCDILICENGVGIYRSLAGIMPVLYLGKEPEQAENVMYIGVRPEESGACMAHLLTDTLQVGDVNGDSTVAYLCIGTDPASEGWMDGCGEGFSATTGMPANCLERIFSDGSREGGASVCQEALSRFGRDIEVIFCGNGELALGVAQAARDAGRLPGEDIYILAQGRSPEIEAAIADGTLAGTVYEEQQKLIDVILQHTSDVLQTGIQGSAIYVGVTGITVKNLPQ